MSQQSLLYLENVTKQRLQGGAYTLRIPKLIVHEGERLAILGASGSGKSTVMDMLAFLLEPNEADAFTFSPTAENSYNIKALWQTHAHDALASLRLQHLGIILQSGALLPFLSVHDNMELAQSARLNQVDQGNDTEPTPIKDLANELGIAHLLNAMPHTLSLGERQRVAIGRTLAARPNIILADEPTAALDPVHAQTVMELLKQALDATKTTLIFVTHDIELAQNNATRLLYVKLETEETSTHAQTVIATLSEDAYV